VNYPFIRSCQFDGPVLDGIYQAAFGYKEDGLFVEAGASNGEDHSNTWGLSRIGWRGIYIEPVASLASACQANHQHNPLIKTIHAAAAAHDGAGTVWFIPEWGTSTLNEQAAATISPHPLAQPCRMIKLDTVLAAEGWPARYDLLVIDVDFGEIEVLRGCNLQRWRPTLAIVETHEKTMDTGIRHPFSGAVLDFANAFFAAAGYQKVYADYINTVFRCSPPSLVNRIC
jgi:FkbM family methyltransferase